MTIPTFLPHYNPYLLPSSLSFIILPIPSFLHIPMPPPVKNPKGPVHSSLPASVVNQAQAAAMNAAVPGLLIGTSPMGMSTLGYVDKRMANMMVLNESIASLVEKTGIRHTVPHEFEHILQNRAANRYDTSWDQQVVAEYSKLGGSAAKLIQNLERSAASVPLRERLQSIAGSTPAAYIGGLPGKQFSLAEQFAELSSLEAYSGKDLTKDPVVRKEFFGDDDAMIAAYRATTGLRQERLDARDLPPMTATPPAPAAKEQATGVLEMILDAAKKVMK